MSSSSSISVFRDIWLKSTLVTSESGGIFFSNSFMISFVSSSDKIVTSPSFFNTSIHSSKRVIFNSPCYFSGWILRLSRRDFFVPLEDFPYLILCQFPRFVIILKSLDHRIVFNNISGFNIGTLSFNRELNQLIPILLYGSLPYFPISQDHLSSVTMIEKLR